MAAQLPTLTWTPYMGDGFASEHGAEAWAYVLPSGAGSDSRGRWTVGVGVGENEAPCVQFAGSLAEAQQHAAFLLSIMIWEG